MSRQIDADVLKETLAKYIAEYMMKNPGKNMSQFYVGVLDKVDELTTLSLDALRDEIYQDAVAHGLWEGAEYETSAQMGAEMYCAAHRIGDEVRELCDEARRACLCKEHRYSEELADVIIMALSTAGHFNIDIDAKIRRKMAINKERPWKHGKE